MMQRSSRIAKRFAMFAVLTWVLTAAASVHAVLDEKVLSDIDIKQNIDATLPLDLAFIDDQGVTRSLRTFFGKRPVIVAPIYFDCPMLCSQFGNGLLRSLNALSLNLKDDYEVLFVSFNPKDAIAGSQTKLKVLTAGYREKTKVGGFHVLTGDEKSIGPLMDALGFRYTFDPVSGHFAHASAMVIATPTGKISKYFFGIDFNVRDLKFSLIEASSNKVGSIADRLLLFCYHYDPSKGKYGFAIQRVIQVAGMSTVLGLLTFIGMALRRERDHV